MSPAEIPLRRKYLKVSNSSQPSSKGGNSGGGKKSIAMPMPKGAKEQAMAVTKANQMILLLVGGKHRRFIRADSL